MLNIPGFLETYAKGVRDVQRELDPGSEDKGEFFSQGDPVLTSPGYVGEAGTTWGHVFGTSFGKVVAVDAEWHRIPPLTFAVVSGPNGRV